MTNPDKDGARLLNGKALEGAAIAWVMRYEREHGRDPVDIHSVKGSVADIESSGRLIEVKSTATVFRLSYLALQPGQLERAMADAAYHVYVVEHVGAGDDPSAITLRILAGDHLRSLVAKARPTVSYEVPWPTADYDTTPIEPPLQQPWLAMPGHPDKFAWSEGDVQIHPGPYWGLSYQEGDATILVQDADGLLAHLRQHGMVGDDRTIVRLFLASPRAELLPGAIEAELIRRGLTEG